MSSPAAFLAVAVELALMLVGLALSWRVQMSPAARAQRPPPALTAWTIALPDFGLFAWCVIVGGVLGQLAMTQGLKSSTLDGDTRQVLAGAAFQLGLLGGCVGFALFALGDDSSPIAQTGATVTAESLNGGTAIPSTDAWYPLAFRGSIANPLTAVTVKVSASTKVLGTDYLLDLVGGRVYIIAGGSIVAGTSIVTVDYTYPTLTAGTSALDRVLAGTKSDVTGLMRFVGVPAKGPTWEAILWKVTLTPDGDLPLIMDDYGEFKLKGAILSDGVHTDLYQLIKRG